MYCYTNVNNYSVKVKYINYTLMSYHQVKYLYN